MSSPVISPVTPPARSIASSPARSIASPPARSIASSPARSIAARRRLLLLAAALSVAACQTRSSSAPSPSAAPAAASTPSPLAARLRPILDGAAGVPLAGIAVAGVAADGTAWEAAVGCARFLPDGRGCQRALTAASPMRVASITKLFTTVLVMQLVQRGALDLDAEVTRLLGLPLRNPAFPDAPLTLRALLSHTSSLRDGAVYSAPPPATLASLLAEPGRFDLEHPPGAYFHYDNINFVVVGAILERAAGMRFDQLMRTAVLAPAGVDAGQAWSGVSAEARARHAALYRRRTAEEVWQPGGPWLPQVDEEAALPELPPAALGENPFAWSPHGGLRISVRDLAALLRLLLTGEALLGKPALAAMLAPRRAPAPGEHAAGLYDGFGLGVHAARLGARRVHGHFGDAYGLKAGALFDESTGEVWVYAITGYGDAPPPGSPRYPGLDGAEAAILDVLASR